MRARGLPQASRPTEHGPLAFPIRQPRRRQRPHLAYRAEADLAEDEDQRLGGEGFVPALSLHCCSLDLQVPLHS